MSSLKREKFNYCNYTFCFPFIVLSLLCFFFLLFLFFFFFSLFYPSQNNFCPLSRNPHIIWDKSAGVFFSFLHRGKNVRATQINSQFRKTEARMGSSGKKRGKKEKREKKREKNRERFRKNEFVNRSLRPSGCTRAKAYFRNCRDVSKHTFGQQRDTGILFEFIIVIVPVVIFPQVELLTNFKVKLEFSGSKVEIGAK